MLCNCESHFPIKITTAGAFARTHLHLSFKMRIEVTALTVRQFSEKLTFYQDHMERCLLPFWEKALDHENGGVYTCFDNSGEHLISKDKFTWSQGRFLWLWSRLAAMFQTGMLNGDADAYVRHAKKTFSFIERHAFLENGNCAFLLSETGEKKEPVPGQGYDTSFYADCFVIMGYSEYARLTGDRSVYNRALEQYDQLTKRLEAGTVRSEPYPVPDGCEAHGYSMIMLNVSQELADTAELKNWPHAQRLRQRSQDYLCKIMNTFMDEQGRVREVLPLNSENDELVNSILVRHLNPGHTIECMWFVMAEAEKTGNKKIIELAVKAIKKAFELGWDDEHGGLFRYVDLEGGKPDGQAVGGPFEQLVTDTWDTKLWWPHSEALYSTLLGWLLTKDEDMLRLHHQVHDYAFRTFPHSDPSIGEWIQIRSRAGEPMNSVVALPVKDPYHILRNLMLCVERLQSMQR